MFDSLQEERGKEVEALLERGRRRIGSINTNASKEGPNAKQQVAENVKSLVDCFGGRSHAGRERLASSTAFLSSGQSPG
jgi:hypothetical protein